jgi:glycosyltransferase involved in cell wall biosynthesis
MTENPLVSVVTIVYNGKKFIEQAIHSVLNQSYPNIEYVIIDGGSNDGTVDIIKKYEPRLAYWISEKDEGISDAFNKGIRKCSGKIIGILNADDWYETDTVRKVVETIGDYDVAFGDVQYWKNEKKSFRQEGTAEHLEEEVSVIHPTVFVKKECYDKFGLFDKNFKCAMDYELLLRLKLNGCRFVHIPAVLTNMRWEGFSDKRWILGCKETLAIKNRNFPDRKKSNYKYYYRTIVAISLIKTIERLGLNFIVKMYRENFSRLKKKYN